MAINYPGPFEVRINYITNENVAIRNHQIRFSCRMAVAGNVGDPFTSWFPYIKDGSSAVSLDARVDSLITWLKALYHSTTTFVDAELWEYADGTFDSAFRSVKSLNVVGTNAGATVEFSQAIMTFRTFGGGIMKVDFRGCSYAKGARVAVPASGPVFDFKVYILGNTSPWWARDNSYPATALWWLPGENEHAFKKVNR